MLQRNVSGGALLLPTVDPPIEVPAGGEIDHPEPLAGFIPVEDSTATSSLGSSTSTSPTPPPDPGSSKPPGKTSSAAPAAGSTGEGATA